MPKGYGKEEWAWALVTIDNPRQDEAVELLRKLAVRQHFSGKWYIRRINVVVPLKEKKFRPLNHFSMFVGIKAQDKKTLIRAFNSLEETLHKRGFSHVEGHRVTLQPFSANW